MSRAFLRDQLRGIRRRSHKSTNPFSCRRRGRSLVRPLNPLVVRLVPAGIPTFNTGTLSIFGDGPGDTITVSRDTAGGMLVNGGGVPIPGRAPTVARTHLIRGFGQGGNDQIALGKTNGALPKADLIGVAGNDTLIGVNGSDELIGGPGQDVLVGGPGDNIVTPCAEGRSAWQSPTAPPGSGNPRGRRMARTAADADRFHKLPV